MDEGDDVQCQDNVVRFIRARQHQMAFGADTPGEVGLRPRPSAAKEPQAVARRAKINRQI